MNVLTLLYSRTRYHVRFARSPASVISFHLASPPSSTSAGHYPPPPPTPLVLLSRVTSTNKSSLGNFHRKRLPDSAEIHQTIFLCE
ncbi:hypothetical protein CDAR_14491 [Caerostris darwini]|uniref:Uncharacterized protein n=1 Tax=Caerostris darwini TaxID=1538125 RepID=A0AAV4WMK3_9ARAC|nr:hypothetical protein CDAR_14491 [Caerostris darwini]